METEAPASGPQPRTDANSTKQLLDHPIVKVLEFILACLGVVLAVVFYYQSRFRKEPYFYVDPTRSILVNRELAIGQKLSVTFESRAAQHGDITAMQCYFWNAGRASIHSVDTLQPVKLALEAGNEILDVSVVRQSRPEIMQFRVVADKNSDGSFSNTATVSFNILEQNDGVSLQILYAGNPQAALSFAGAIEGARIKRLPRPLDALRDSGARESELRRSSYQVFGLLAAFPVILACLPLIDFVFERKLAVVSAFYKEILAKKTFWIFYFFWLVLLGLVYYYLFYLYPAVPVDVIT
jgi:hypothetical protein